MGWRTQYTIESLVVGLHTVWPETFPNPSRYSRSCLFSLPLLTWFAAWGTSPRPIHTASLEEDSQQELSLSPYWANSVLSIAGCLPLTKTLAPIRRGTTPERFRKYNHFSNYTSARPSSPLSTPSSLPSLLGHSPSALHIHILSFISYMQCTHMAFSPTSSTLDGQNWGEGEQLCGSRKGIVG